MKRVKIRRVCVITPYANGSPAGEPGEVSGEWIGALRKAGNEIMFSFTETDDDGEKIFNRLIWSDGILTHDRRGAITSRFVFRVGETLPAEISFPLVTLELTVTTENVMFLPTSDGIYIHVLFTTVFAGDSRKTEWTFTVTPTEESN